MTDGRRRPGCLLVVLAVLAAVFVAADVAARIVAERELAARVRGRVPEAGEVSARIHSFPFLVRLLGSGRVDQVDARATAVKVRGLELDLITVDLDGVKLDRRILVDEARVVVYDIDRGRVRAEVTEGALADRLGFPVRLEAGRASVTVAGQRISAEVAVRDGRLVVGAVGVPLPSLDLVTPLVPCLANAEIVMGRVLLTCDFTDVPEVLRAGAPL